MGGGGWGEGGRCAGTGNWGFGLVVGLRAWGLGTGGKGWGLWFGDWELGLGDRG